MKTSSRTPSLGDRRGRQWRHPVFFAALVAALVTIFFHRVLISGDVFFFRDFALFFYPKRLLAAAAARRWEVPFWESFSAGGQPVLGAYQAAFFYPLSIVYYLFDMPRSFMLFVVAHFALTAAGTYFLLRTFRASRTAAGVGALLWTFAPAFVSIIEQVSFLTSLAWLPWCLAFAKRLLDDGAYGAFLGVVVSFAMAILAGAPEPVIFTTAFVGLLVVWEVVSAAREGRLGKASARGGLAAAALLIAGLVSGAALGPFFHLLANSERGEGLSLKMAGLWSMSPRDAAVWLLPRFHLQLSGGGLHWPQQAWLKSVYMGAGVPVLALWAVVARRRGRELLFAAAGLAFLSLSLGVWSPVWRLCYGHVPGFSLIRYPVKFFVPVAFAASVLAAFAVDEILRRRVEERLKAVYVLAGVAAGLAVVFLLLWMALGIWPDYFRAHVPPPRITGPRADKDMLAALQFLTSKWSLARSAAVLLAAAVAVWAVSAVRKPRTAAFLLAVVIVGDVMLFGRDLNPTTGPQIFTERPGHLEAVQTGPGAGRLYSTRTYRKYTDDVSLSAFADFDSFFRYVVAVKGPGLASPSEMVKWTSWASGRRFKDLAELREHVETEDYSMILEVAQMESHKESFCPNLHLLSGVYSTTGQDVLAVVWTAKLVKRLKDTDEDGSLTRRLFAASRIVDFTLDEPHFGYSQVEDPVARAFLAYGVEAAESDEAALATVAEKDFDPRTTLVVVDDARARAKGCDSRALDEALLGRNVSLSSLEPPYPPPAQAPPQEGSVKWVADTGNRQTIDVNAPAPALLYLADAWYPALRARIDGAVEAPVARANCAFRAVPVPAGIHRVEIFYRPVGLYWGLAATLLGVAVLVVLRFAWRRQEKRSGEAAPSGSR